MTLLGDVKGVSTAAGNWMAEENQYKIHTFLQQHADGLLYMATMDHDPTPFLRGAHVYTIDPAVDPADGAVVDASQHQPFLLREDLTVIPNPGLNQAQSGVLVETYGLKGIGLNPRVPDLVYYMTYPDGHLIKQQLSTGALEVVGQSPFVSYVFYVDNRGDVYFAVEAASGFDLVRYDVSAGSSAPVAHVDGLTIGAIAPTADGETVYFLIADTKEVHRLDCVTGDLDYVTTACGTNWWRLFNLALSPDGESLLYVSNNNAHSTFNRIDLLTGTCSEVLDIDALLGSRDLCFGGVNMWDRQGRLYAPVWTFDAPPDLAILQVDLGELPLTASPKSLSVARGGTQHFQLRAGPDQAGQPYQLLGSITGTDPGQALDLPHLLRLNRDAYTRRTESRPGRTPLVRARGFLDAIGRATASFRLPSMPHLGLVGLEVHHAFVVTDATSGDVRFVSNPVSVRLR